MWFFICAGVVVYLWYISLFWSPLHLFIVFTLFYVLFYVFRSSHQNGTWQWKWFRSLPLWDKLRDKHFAHSWHQFSVWRDFQRRGESYLFIVVSSDPIKGRFGVGTIVPFGIYGRRNEALARLSPLITAPAFFFYIPILCDFLQLCGCIVDTPASREEALMHNISLVWSPQTPPDLHAIVQDPLSNCSEPETGCMKSLPDDTFEWLSKYTASLPKGRRVNIVPVYSVGEEGTYYDATPRLCLPFQQWCRARMGYFPRMLFGWMGTPFPRRCVIKGMQTLVGEPIPSQFEQTGENKGKLQLISEFTASIRLLVRSAHPSLSLITEI